MSINFQLKEGMRTRLTVDLSDAGSLVLREPPGVEMIPLGGKSNDSETDSGASGIPVELALLDEETGLPFDIAGISVSLLDEDNRIHAGNMGEGIARWDRVPPGTLRIIVDDSNFTTLV